MSFIIPEREPLSSPTFSSSSSSFDFVSSDVSSPSYDSDDEIVWSLSSSAISTESNHSRSSESDFVALSRVLSPSITQSEPSSASDLSLSDVLSSVASMSSSEEASAPTSPTGKLTKSQRRKLRRLAEASSAPATPVQSSKPAPSLPLMPSRVLNVDYPTPTPTPTPRTLSQSTPAFPVKQTVTVLASTKEQPTVTNKRAKVQAQSDKEKAHAKKTALEEAAKKAVSKATERKGHAKTATAKANDLRARAKAIAGKSEKQIEEEKKEVEKATKTAKRARQSARKAEKKAKEAKSAAASFKPSAELNSKQKVPPTHEVPAVSVGLGMRPIVDDSTLDVVSEKGDEPSSYTEASEFITSFINDPETAQTKSKVHRLALLQSLIIELGISTTSMLPRSISAAKALLKSTVFINIHEYLSVRGQSQDALKRILLPSKKALIKDIRAKGPTPRNYVKQHGLQALLIQCYR